MKGVIGHYLYIVCPIFLLNIPSKEKLGNTKGRYYIVQLCKMTAAAIAIVETKLIIILL